MNSILMPLIFLLGIVAIALEDIIKINKSAIAIMMCVSLWGLLIVDAPESVNNQNIVTEQLASTSGTNSFQNTVAQIATRSEIVEKKLIEHMGDVSETIFFVMCSMLLIAIVDKHGGFTSIANTVQTNSKRTLLWYLCLSSFFFSALLDNLAAAIVVVAILHRLVPNATDRLKYACMVIISCNAGGAWSPIGDVTTLLLWTGGGISSLHQIAHLFLPSLVNMLIPLVIAHFCLFEKGASLRQSSLKDSEMEYYEYIPTRHRRLIFWWGILSLVMIPVYQIVFSIPPFIGIMIGVAIMWCYTDVMYRRLHNIKESDKLSIAHLLGEVDMATILYFLGILMSVGALEASGQLTEWGTFVSNHFRDSSFVAFVVGFCSSFVDNVALVAATMGMYPIDTNPVSAFALDGSFWTFLAYCGVTGGSLLIIGSATGVMVMGFEKISFGYYAKHFSMLALLGYIGGAATYLLLLS